MASATKAANIPAELEDKFKSCKEQVMADGESEDSAYAICYTSVVEGKSLEDARAQHKAEDTAEEALMEDVEIETEDEPEERLGLIESALRDLLAVLNSIGIKLGARHSKADNEAVQSVHDLSLQLGALCTGKAKSAFGVCKGLDGNYYGLGVVTNCYEDLDEEIIRDKAHKEFASYLNDNPGEAPELWTWHTPGTARKSRAVWWDYTDNGFFWRMYPLTEDEAKALQPITPCAMSHQFNGIKEGSEWAFYRTFEDSVLPVGAEANPYTSFEIATKERIMKGFTPEQRAFLVKVHGEGAVKELEEQEEVTRKALDLIGVQRKEKKAEAEKAKAETIPTAPTTTPPIATLTQADMINLLSDAVKMLSDEVTGLGARVKALTETRTKEVAAQVEAATDARMSWLTSPRAPATGIAEQAKKSGGQINPEELAAMGVPVDDPSTAWTKEIKRTTR